MTPTAREEKTFISMFSLNIHFNGDSMNQIIKARLLGLLIVLIGLGGIIFNWYSVINRNQYLLKASFLFPIFVFLGISIIIYPTTKEINIAKYGTEQLPLKYYPRGQKILILIGLVGGVLNWALLSGTIPLSQ
jgi:hypothetical protein